MVHFDINRVYTRAIETFGRGIAQMLILGLLALVSMGAIATVTLLGLATAGFHFTAVSFESSITNPFGLLVLSVGLLLYILLAYLIQAMVRELVAQVFSGYEPHLRVAYAWAIHRYWQYLWTACLMTIGVFIGLLPAIVIGFFAAFEYQQKASPLGVVGLVFLAILVFLIGIVVVSVILSLSYYLVAKEGVSGFAAIQRSRQLIGRAFGWSFVTILIVAFVGGLLGMIPFIGYIATILMSLFSPFLYGALYEELRLIENGVIAGPIPPSIPDVTPSAPEPIDFPEEPLPTPLVVAPTSVAKRSAVGSRLTRPRTSKTNSSASKKA